jgi:hypothetical protein
VKFGFIAKHRGIWPVVVVEERSGQFGCDGARRGRWGALGVFEVNQRHALPRRTNAHIPHVVKAASALTGSSWIR